MIKLFYLTGLMVLIWTRGYTQSFSVSADTNNQTTTVQLLGKVLLRDISTVNDTTFDHTKYQEVKVLVRDLTKGAKPKKKIFTVNTEGRIYLHCDYNRQLKIEFKCKKYQTKILIINTLKLPEWKEDFKYGFDIPFEINLVYKRKGVKGNYRPVEVATYKYRHETGYFDYK